MRKLAIAGMTGLMFTAGCSTPPVPVEGADDVADINALVDDWHDAASKADFNRYFGHLSTEAVFIGTDDTEYWKGRQFRDFANPYFSQGKGWTYVPVERHVYVSDNRETAWFDEKLDNEKYGRCRGTGVCVLTPGGWRIVHYTLSFPVPNDVAEPVVKIIAEHARAAPAPAPPAAPASTPEVDQAGAR
ncbi:MAG: hypothetical protein AMXMBFR58_36830 [Phycisphaerae bacterium]